MKLVIGLGNPGKEYEKTRHNIGFIFIDKLFKNLKNSNYKFSEFKWNKKFLALISKGTVNKEKIILVKPQTYMNNSGKSVEKLVRFYKLNPKKDLLIIYDDIDLPLGTLRAKGKSAAGHKGMQSIIDSLNTQNIKRIRMGIKNTKGEIKDIKIFVLEKFTEKEKKIIDKNAKLAIAKIKDILEI